MEDIDEIVNKWKETGLLEELPEYRKSTMALLCERMAKYIMGLDLGIKSYGEEMTETIIFPIVYRIIKNGRHIDDVVSLYNEVVHYMNINKERIKEAQATAYFNIDIEAEFTMMFVEEYLRRPQDPIKPLKHIRGWEK
jgi:hypothetical protein